LAFFGFFLIEKFLRIGGHSHDHSHDNNEKETKDEKEEKSPANAHINFSGYLNLIADISHNFTDGLAISAAFHASHALGVTTTLACFFHEIPHEFGDFAILIRSGFSRTRAILLQVVTASGAFLGAFVGNWVAGKPEGINELILPFTAGGFMYVATVSIIPDLLADTSRKAPGRATQMVKEGIAMAIGVAFMYWIAINE